MSEIYRAGAALTRGLSRAASYLGRRSEEASERLRRAADEAEQRRYQDARSPEPQPKSGVEEFRERADAWADDLSDKLKAALARAREEGPEFAQVVRREASEAISRINAAVSDRAKPESPRDGFVSKDASAGDAKIDSSVADEDRQAHF